MPGVNKARASNGECRKSGTRHNVVSYAMLSGGLRGYKTLDLGGVLRSVKVAVMACAQRFTMDCTSRESSRRKRPQSAALEYLPGERSGRYFPPK